MWFACCQPPGASAAARVEVPDPDAPMMWIRVVIVLFYSEEWLRLLDCQWISDGGDPRGSDLINWIQIQFTFLHHVEGRFPSALDNIFV